MPPMILQQSRQGNKTRNLLTTTKPTIHIPIQNNKHYYKRKFVGPPEDNLEKNMAPEWRPTAILI